MTINKKSATRSVIDQIFKGVWSYLISKDTYALKRKVKININTQRVFQISDLNTSCLWYVTMKHKVLLLDHVVITSSRRHQTETIGQFPYSKLHFFLNCERNLDCHPRKIIHKFQTVFLCEKCIKIHITFEMFACKFLHILQPRLQSSSKV